MKQKKKIKNKFDDPQKRLLMNFKQKPFKKFSSDFLFVLALKMLENVVLFNIFENALKKVNNRQIHTRTAKMRFDGYLVFFCAFSKFRPKGHL